MTDVQLPEGAELRQIRVVSSHDAALVRASDETGAPRLGFRGHAAVFGQRSWIGSDWYGYYEQIARGAFRKTVQEADVRFLQNHDVNYVLGRTASKTLRLSEDDEGLLADADMADTSYARDLAVLLDRGDVNQMSFAFDPIVNRVERITDGADRGKLLVTRLEVRLWDVSVVTYPAYVGTDASLRSLAASALTLPTVERAALAEQLSRSLRPDSPPEPTTTPPAGPATATRTQADHMRRRHAELAARYARNR